MQSIDDIILMNVNPFDNVYCSHVVNNSNSESNITYLHQETFIKIEILLSQISQDHITRTVLITGNSGCGKTYLLTRLKNQLSHKACFVNIPPFAKRDSIWRRILRYTVDSLVKRQNNNQPSPLLLHLLKVKEEKDTILGFFRTEKQKFINRLKEKYKKVNIYNSDDFFGILYELINPELYDLSCQYLRGEDLTAESLQSLGVEKSINTETAAREILTNFGIISCEIQPIILCFNQIESIARLPNGSLDLDALLQVNAKIREDNNNYMMIISICSNRWEEYKDQIQPLYQGDINQKIELKDISLAQAELILGSRLDSIHRQANSLPSSSLYPLNRQVLEKVFPIGRINFRDVIICGRDLFKAYKEWLVKDDKATTFTFYKETQDKLEIISYFKVRWYEEFSRIQQQITRINQLSSTELIQDLQAVLLALQMQEVSTSLFIRSKYASYSLVYKLKNKNIGVIWTEDPNLESFFYVMEACRKILEKNPSLKLHLIRSQSLGDSQSKGYKVYKDIFVNSKHCYIIPDLHSVHYLATYHSLVRTAREGDLVVGSKIISLKNLQSLIVATKILDNCSLLQDLGIVKKTDVISKNDDSSGDLNTFNPMKKHTELKDAKDYIFNLVITQSCLSRQVLLKNVGCIFPQFSEVQLDGLIQQLCWENKMKIIYPKAHLSSQLVTLFPRK
ncbi:ATP-binding protein [Okeanomitos corallinicola TIOX110]|uniref:ATP-binding protein n=1 Tax=Okeanomitos corallinicola TIOX110 TaxID=3133117 RepID=A0ABZ2UUB8_9CYAN